METRKRRITDVSDDETVTPVKAAKHSYKAIPKVLTEDESVSETKSETKAKSTVVTSDSLTFNPFNFNPSFTPNFTYKPAFDFLKDKNSSTYNPDPMMFKPSDTAPITKTTPIIRLSNSSSEPRPTVCSRFLLGGGNDNIADDQSSSDDNDDATGDNSDTTTTTNKIVERVNEQTLDIMHDNTHEGSKLDLAPNPHRSRAKYNNGIIKDAIGRIMFKHVNTQLKNSEHIVLQVNQQTWFEKKVENNTLTINLNDLADS